MLERRYNKFVVVGMGGSHLAADLVKMALPDLDIVVHSDYGLPKVFPNILEAQLPEEVELPLIVVVSHSGNTEEAIVAFYEAIKNNWSVVAVSVNGQLLELAKQHNIPYIQLPDLGLQPRFATQYHLEALLKIMGQEIILPANLVDQEEAGGGLAQKLKDKIPIIYSSTKNWALANNWKVRINETSKAPAFCNVFPELNHNEMVGFDPTSPRNAGLRGAGSFYFIFIKDHDDHPQILKRMAATQQILEDRNFGVTILELEGNSIWEKILNNINLADAATRSLAQLYNIDPEQVPLVEEFKKLIA